MFAKQRGPIHPKSMGPMNGYPHPMHHPQYQHIHHPPPQWPHQPRPRQQQPFQPGPRRRQLPENFQQQQKPKFQAKEFFMAPFTDHEGKFDIGRTANTVDQVVKTVQQVSPYVAKVGSFFIK